MNKSESLSLFDASALRTGVRLDGNCLLQFTSVFMYNCQS